MTKRREQVVMVMRKCVKYEKVYSLIEVSETGLRKDLLETVEIENR